MKISVILIFAAAVLLPFQNNLQAQNSSEACAREKIENSITAFGGLEILNSLHTLKITAVGHRLMREQSERPDGPFIADYFDLEVQKDLGRKQTKYSQDFKLFGYNLTYLINDSLVARDVNQSGRWFPTAMTFKVDPSLAPESILLTALQADDLHCQQDTLLQKIPHSVISFSKAGHRVKIFLNKNTNLITAVENLGEYKADNYHVWGDIPATVYYSMYGLEKNGLKYPYQMDVYLDGRASENIMILSVEQNPVLEDSLSFPDASKELLLKYFGKDLSAPLASDKAIEEADGIHIIPGSWFTTIVKQDEGLVILEAPISSRFAEQIPKLSKNLYPGQKIKAVISTSSAWPHVGGLRPFIAAGVPVFHSPLNTRLIEQLAAAEYITSPDEQQKAQKKLNPVLVSEKRILGNGVNRMEIYPINAESSEGMMMVYFPAHKLLYTSDLIQSIDPAAQPLFREYAQEVLQAIAREKLEVEKIFGMHLAPTPFIQLQQAFYEGLSDPKI